MPQAAQEQLAYILVLKGVKKTFENIVACVYTVTLVERDDSI